MGVFLMTLVFIGGVTGFFLGMRVGGTTITDLIMHWYPEAAEYILCESKDAYDEEELILRAELLRAKDRDRG